MTETRKRPARKAEKSEKATQWTARDEKIVLPSSGLAADILALPESAAVEPLDRAAVERLSAQPPEPEPEPEVPVLAHSASFFAAPAREERQVAAATEHLATFFLDAEEYGVDVRLVQEIIRVSEITQVPRSPSFVKGVINLRGRIVPVVDLKRKLALGEVDADARPSRIVVAKLKERLVGLLVDGANQVLKVPVTSIESPPEEVVAKGGADYIRGVAKLEKRLIILMDLHKVLFAELREGATAS
jgi:purine-binding chemotaxis protein CheW